MSEYGGESELAAELALADSSQNVPGWFRGVAFTILVLSVITAVAALLAGITANEAVLERTEEIIDLSVAQTAQLEVEVLRTKHSIQTALGQPVSAAELEQISRFEAEEERLREEARSAELATSISAANHLLLAIAATVAAVAIAVTGLAPIVHQRWLWIVGASIGVFATGMLAIGVTRMFA